MKTCALFRSAAAGAALAALATGIAGYLYLMLVSPGSGATEHVQGLVVFVFSSPFLFLLLGALLGVTAPFLISHIGRPLGTVVLVTLCGGSGGLVGYLFTAHTPAIPALPAVLLSAVSWAAIAGAAIFFSRRSTMARLGAV